MVETLHAAYIDLPAVGSTSVPERFGNLRFGNILFLANLPLPTARSTPQLKDRQSFKFTNILYLVNLSTIAVP